MSMLSTSLRPAQGEGRSPQFADASLVVRRHPTFWEEWRAGVESVVLTALQNDVRSLGVIGIGRRVGVSVVSGLIADALVRTGYRTLHIDLSFPSRNPAVGQGGGQGWTSLHHDPEPWIVDGANCASQLVARPTPDTRDHFCDPPHFRDLLAEGILDYRHLVLDLPPFVDRAEGMINPVAAATACDAVVLLCLRSQTTRAQLNEAVAVCQSNRIKLVGLIVNEFAYVSVAQEVARAARRIFRVVPPIARRLEARALKAGILQ